MFGDRSTVCAVAEIASGSGSLGSPVASVRYSVAAHTREASRARSDAEFCSKIDGALQEADESQLWIELLREDCAIGGANIAKLLAETNELIAIFVTMVNNTQRKNQAPR